jgi:hypothetical protein
MNGRISYFLASVLAIAGCSDGGSTGAGTSPQMGAGGSSTGTGGSSTGGDSTGTGGDAAGATGTGGAPGEDASVGTGGDSTGETGGATSTDDGGSETGGASGTGGAGTAGADGTAGFIGWYEAEAKPPNELFGRAVVSHCKNPCPSMATLKPGDTCCSGGGQVDWIVSGGHGPDPQPPDGRGGGELRYNAISAPADGMYDVTWWYHCGNNDNFGDGDCGGQTDPPTDPKAGCRPHQIIVNGTEMPGTYHFPCFGGSWGIIRAATTTLPLKAGNMNTIHVYATKPRDAADMDALQISAVGKGVPPLIKSNSDPIGH